eukprot:COSAG05_NODE_1468_length_4793_cov_6.365069_4_plen_168_part_00
MGPEGVSAPAYQGARWPFLVWCALPGDPRGPRGTHSAGWWCMPKVKRQASVSIGLVQFKGKGCYKIFLQLAKFFNMFPNTHRPHIVMLVQSWANMAFIASNPILCETFFVNDACDIRRHKSEVLMTRSSEVFRLVAHGLIGPMPSCNLPYDHGIGVARIGLFTLAIP